MELRMLLELQSYLAWWEALVCDYHPPGYVVVLYECRVACGIYEGNTSAQIGSFFSRSYAYSTETSAHPLTLALWE